MAQPHRGHHDVDSSLATHGVYTCVANQTDRNTLRTERSLFLPTVTGQHKRLMENAE